MIDQQTPLESSAFANVTERLANKAFKGILEISQFTHDVRSHFNIVHGTPEEHPSGLLTAKEQANYCSARRAAIELYESSGDDLSFSRKLNNLLQDSLKTRGGLAFLVTFLHHVEINVPGAFDDLAPELEQCRPMTELGPDSKGMTSDVLRACRLASAATSVMRLNQRASLDLTRPVFHAATSSGWVNDPNGLCCDQQGNLHVGFQHNPFSESWGNMHWGHGVYRPDGSFEQLPVWLEPRPEDGYTQVFSGGMLSKTVPHPDGSGRQVRAAFFTAVGTGPNTFHGAPPTVMAICSDPSLIAFETKRFTRSGYKYDTLNGDNLDNRYDMRDPCVFERDGRLFMIVAGTSRPNRQGTGLIALLEPSDPADISKPWKYVGDIFRHPRETVDDGGPGIIECPNMGQLRDEHGGEVDLLIFSSQRREKDGPLAGYHNHQAVEYRLGRFNAESTFEEISPNHERVRVIDYGKAFYAPNMTARPDGAGMTLMGWVVGFEDRHDWKEMFEGGRGWCGCATVPRTLTLRDGDLHVEPDEKVAKLRQEAVISKAFCELQADQSMEAGAATTTFDLEAKVLLQDRSSSATLRILCNRDREDGLAIRIERDKIWVGDEFIPLENREEKPVSLRVLCDKSLVEVYAEGRVLTKVVTPTTSSEHGVDPAKLFADSVRLSASGGAASFSDLSVYTMSGI